MPASIFTALLISICTVESGGHKQALNVNDGGRTSYGYCQVQMRTARHMGFRGSVKELWLNPDLNMYYAGKYLEYQLKRYRSAEKAIAAYNRGSFKADKNGRAVNHKYVVKVLREWRKFVPNARLK
jgi:soluble lytic murein transglycosylase-like protein